MDYEIFTFFFALIVLVYPVSAELNNNSSIFDIFDEMTQKTFTGDWNIPIEYPQPHKIEQASQHIRVWIDIVGFENTLKIGEKYYLNGSSVPKPFIEYEIWDEGLIWDDNFDWMVVTDERFYTENNNTTAEIDIHLLWHRSTLKSRPVCGLNGCIIVKWIKKDYYHEYATFSKSVPTPTQYPELEPQPCYITIYNNSFNPHIEVFVPVDNYQIKTAFQYEDEAIVRFNKVGYAEIGAVNLTDIHQWSESTDKLLFLGNSLIITDTNTSQFNKSNLTVTVYNPYEQKTITDYNITEITHESGKEFNPLFYCVVALVLIFIIWISINLRSIKL